MDRRTAWLIAARPRTLPAAAAPVLVGGGLAAGDGVFRTGPFLAALIGALAIQVAANFANDASDAARGADTPDRIGPPRMVAEGIISARRMWVAVWVSVAVAAAAGVYLIAVAGWVIALIGALSVLAMLSYVGGPIPYGYRALGEVSVFVFFGLVATVGSRFVHDRTAPLDAWVLGVVMGLMASAILVANNLRDLDTDAETGKRTLAVVLGRARTRSLFSALLAGAFAVILVGAVTGVTPPASGLAIVLAPFAVPLARTARQAVDGPTLIGVLAGVARLQLLVGIFIAAGSAV
jgi:1,4-dihydroxy-2-naphthoate octaprenyltransferase